MLQVRLVAQVLQVLPEAQVRQAFRVTTAYQVRLACLAERVTMGPLARLARPEQLVPPAQQEQRGLPVTLASLVSLGLQEPLGLL